MKWNLDEFLKVTSGSLLQKKSTSFNQVSYDTRILKDMRDSCFFALNNKGHTYLEDAFKKGALVLVVSQPDIPDSLKDKVSVIQVSSPMEALKEWAFYWKKKLNVKVVAITGTNGKTSTKCFTQHLFKEDTSISFSDSSFNNDLGVSLSFLKMNQDTQVAVQEVGINQIGEIDSRLKIVQPDYSLCTNVSNTHTEGLKDAITISKEKEKIYKTPSVKVGLFNLDDPFVREMKKAFSKKSLSYSALDPSADIYLQVSAVHLDSIDVKGHIQNKEGSQKIALSGMHHIHTIMAAVSIALALGLSPEEIWKRLAKIQPIEGRCQWLSLKQGLVVFYDAYNANPASMKVFLDYIKMFQNQKNFILCLGDMLELGDQSPQAHEELGKQVGSSGVQTFYYLGAQGKHVAVGLKSSGYKGTFWMSESYNKDFVSKIFSAIKYPDDVLALKASRGLRLERLLEDLSKRRANGF